MQAFAHGGNDVGNTTGPLLIALSHSVNSPLRAAIYCACGLLASRALIQSPACAFTTQGGAAGWMEEGLWLPILGGLCFVLGIVTVGSRTIATVGSKITKLTQASAFSVQSVRPLSAPGTFQSYGAVLSLGAVS